MVFDWLERPSGNGRSFFLDAKNPFMKKRQFFTPSTKSEWLNLTIPELRNKAFEYYKTNIAGKEIYNICTGGIIYFSVKGGRKLLKGGNIYSSKSRVSKNIT